MSPATRTASTKGVDTRSQILAAAVDQASAGGFESLTIGTLADKTGMSKSGLFAHFGSKIDLQLAALDEAARQFTDQVFIPALKVPRGLRRLRAIFDNWISWPQRANLPGGCPIDGAWREYQHQPGAMRDGIVARQNQLDSALTRAVQLAIDTGELRPATDPGQVAFDLLGIILVFFRSTPLLGAPEASRRARVAFERLLEYNTPK